MTLCQDFMQQLVGGGQRSSTVQQKEDLHKAGSSVLGEKGSQEANRGAEVSSQDRHSHRKSPQQQGRAHSSRAELRAAHHSLSRQAVTRLPPCWAGQCNGSSLIKS